MSLRKNIGVVDRAARILIGIALIGLIVLAVTGPRNPLAYLGLVGVIPLTAGIIGYCPPYAWLGINTHKRNQNSR
jgi:hypothetical protein